jgi:DNA-binding CsgD family transcriptional regulator
MSTSALDLWLDAAGAVGQPRLSGDERRTLKILVSERVRELRPYVSPAHEPGGRPWRTSAPGEDDGRQEATPTAPLLLAPVAVTPVAVSAEPTLSAREREVATLLIDGLSNAEIAAALWIGIDTVRTHIKRVIQKTGAKNRTHAAALIVRQQIAHMADSQERVANVV